jgi:hypothetical protein
MKRGVCLPHVAMHAACGNGGKKKPLTYSVTWNGENDYVFSTRSAFMQDTRSASAVEIWWWWWRRRYVGSWSDSCVFSCLGLHVVGNATPTIGQKTEKALPDFRGPACWPHRLYRRSTRSAHLIHLSFVKPLLSHDWEAVTSTLLKRCIHILLSMGVNYTGVYYCDASCFRSSASSQTHLAHMQSPPSAPTAHSRLSLTGRRTSQ